MLTIHLERDNAVTTLVFPLLQLGAVPFQDKCLDNSCHDNYPDSMDENEMYKLDDSLGFIINKTALRIKCELGRSLKKYDLTTEQWVLLHRLWETEGLLQKELAEHIMKDQPNTTRILDKLEQKSLLRRESSATDRRAYMVYLTDVGRDLVEAIYPIVRQVKKKECRGISEEEIELLKSLLNRVWKNMD